MDNASPANYVQVQTCDRCHAPVYITTDSPRVTAWEDGKAKNYHFKCYETSSHPPAAGEMVPEPTTNSNDTSSSLGVPAPIDLPEWVRDQIVGARNDQRRGLLDSGAYETEGALVYLSDAIVRTHQSAAAWKHVATENKRLLDALQSPHPPPEDASA